MASLGIAWRNIRKIPVRCVVQSPDDSAGTCKYIAMAVAAKANTHVEIVVRQTRSDDIPTMGCFMAIMMTIICSSPTIAMFPVDINLVVL